MTLFRGDLKTDACPPYAGQWQLTFEEKDEFNRQGRVSESSQ